MITFLDWLRDFKFAKRITQKQLSAMLQYSASYMSCIENNKRRVPSDFVEKITAMFQLTQEDSMTLRNLVLKHNAEFEMMNGGNIDESIQEIISWIVQLGAHVKNNVSMDFLQSLKVQITQALEKILESINLNYTESML
jgi:transcriptional regulator with XRE-family HTH domain